jgi:ADP-ribose pyrophosphatase YjhB (NUDIX family)
MDLEKKNSRIQNIIEQVKELSQEEKEKLSKTIKIFPRSISLAVIINSKKQLLVDTGFDAIKNQNFYRPLGGGVEFGEHSSLAVVREFKEEAGKEIMIDRYLGTLENIFQFENEKGHEIIFIYAAKFVDTNDYQNEEILVNDKGRANSKAVWRSVHEIQQEKAKLYPDGLEELLANI